VMISRMISSPRFTL